MACIFGSLRSAERASAEVDVHVRPLTAANACARPLPRGSGVRPPIALRAIHGWRCISSTRVPTRSSESQQASAQRMSGDGPWMARTPSTTACASWDFTTRFSHMGVLGRTEDWLISVSGSRVGQRATAFIRVPCGGLPATLCHACYSQPTPKRTTPAAERSLSRQPMGRFPSADHCHA